MEKVELSNNQIELFIVTANNLKGVRKRRFMAQIVQRLGHGGQRYAAEVLGWNRGTIRKGLRELEEQNRSRREKSSQNSVPANNQPTFSKPQSVKLSKELINLYIQTAQNLTGSRRRIFMAQIVENLGPGGQRLAEKEMRWNRGTIRRGIKELEARPGRRKRKAPVKRKKSSKYRIQISPDLIETYKHTANQLSGPRRRIFMAQIVGTLGRGGQRYAEEKLGWNRGVIRMGIRDLKNRADAYDRLSRRGRKSIEVKFPKINADIQDGLTHFKEINQDSDYLPTIVELMGYLISHKSYDPADMPSREIVRKRRLSLS